MFAPVTTSLIYVFLGAQMRINLKLYLFVIHVVSNFIKLRVPNITSPLAFRSSPRWALKYFTHHTLKVVPPDAVPIEVLQTDDFIEIASFIQSETPMWLDVTNSDEIKKLLLARNKRHLQQADIEGGTSSTPIMKQVRSDHGLSEFNNHIDGSHTRNT